MKKRFTTIALCRATPMEIHDFNHHIYSNFYPNPYYDCITTKPKENSILVVECSGKYDGTKSVSELIMLAHTLFIGTNIKCLQVIAHIDEYSKG